MVADRCSWGGQLLDKLTGLHMPNNNTLSTDLLCYCQTGVGM